MAFQRPFDPALVTATTIGITLPDRREETTPSNFARFPKVALRFLAAAPTGANFAFQWPASGAVRRVDLPPAEASALGVTQMAELSPLPFAIAGVLRALGPGLPTFYIGFNGAPLPAQDSAVRRSDAAQTATRAVIACMFQDRM